MQAEVNAEILTVAGGKELPKGRAARVGTAAAAGSPSTRASSMAPSRERHSKEYDAAPARGVSSDRRLMRAGGSEGGGVQGGGLQGGGAQGSGAASCVPSGVQNVVQNGTRREALLAAADAAEEAETEARQAYAEGRVEHEAAAKAAEKAARSAILAAKPPMSLHLTIDNHAAGGAVAAAVTAARSSQSTLMSDSASSCKTTKWQQQQQQLTAERSPCAPGHRAAPVCSSADSCALEAGPGASSSPQLSMLRGDGSTAARLSIQMLRLDSLNTGSGGSPPPDSPLVYGGSHRWLFSPQLLLPNHLEQLAPLPPQASTTPPISAAEARRKSSPAAPLLSPASLGPGGVAVGGKTYGALGRDDAMRAALTAGKPPTSRPRSAPGAVSRQQELRNAQQQQQQQSAAADTKASPACSPLSVSSFRKRTSLQERSQRSLSAHQKHSHTSQGAGAGMMEDQLAALYALYDLRVRDQQQAMRSQTPHSRQGATSALVWSSAEAALAAWHSLRDLVFESNRHVSECVQQGNWVRAEGLLRPALNAVRQTSHQHGWPVRAISGSAQSILRARRL